VVLMWLVPVVGSAAAKILMHFDDAKRKRHGPEDVGWVSVGGPISTLNMRILGCYAGL
jgi:hypothetical protein